MTGTPRLPLTRRVTRTSPARPMSVDASSPDSPILSHGIRSLFRFDLIGTGSSIARADLFACADLVDVMTVRDLVEAIEGMAPPPAD